MATISMVLMVEWCIHKSVCNWILWIPIDYVSLILVAETTRAHFVKPKMQQTD